MSKKVTRKLTTILAADAAGFSRAMDADEEGTYAALHAARDVFGKLITRHGGRIANTAGDGLIADFPSTVEAAQCAIEVQNELGSQESELKFRIGVHLGDVIVDGEDLIGEGVNLAARLQSMAEPGGVLISQQVYDQVHSKLTIGFEYLGEKRPRDLPDDIPIYRISMSRSGSAGRVYPEPLSRFFKPTSQKPANSPTPPQPTYPRSVMLAALISGALVLVNLVSGGGIWAHWPILAAASIAAFSMADNVIPRQISALVPARAVVTIAALTLVNIFSWSGYLWVLWPAGALLIVAVTRKILSQPE
ncbi:adenylate/guanylate cyclase domain-containing protein [Parasedimentitalea marina]|uniref:Adenylate/guanylate cyclase domain-containing protein n=1 Tax=Parasedimentitalea marina TaxID=2483033 RepID=A0A3T0N6G8_9RHOB|nr:adenylate/guanylate cyclase domain-containing protein [Parasedimentitalea marina]AZV79644.1 adenylate/guanylate cyclase domain-containing protein [Parasedimentitalea marina]